MWLSLDLQEHLVRYSYHFVGGQGTNFQQSRTLLVNQPPFPVCVVFLYCLALQAPEGSLVLIEVTKKSAKVFKSVAKGR